MHHRNDRPRTLGFPSLKDEKAKRVRFDPPRSALCITADGLLQAHCRVISVWDQGARLHVQDVHALRDFTLLFSTEPKPVKRHCKRVAVQGNVKRVAVQGNVIEVEYTRGAPSYAKHMEYAP